MRSTTAQAALAQPTYATETILPDQIRANKNLACCQCANGDEKRRLP